MYQHRDSGFSADESAASSSASIWGGRLLAILAFVLAFVLTFVAMPGCTPDHEIDGAGTRARL